MSGRHPPSGLRSLLAKPNEEVWEQLSGIAATLERERDVAKSVCTQNRT